MNQPGFTHISPQELLKTLKGYPFLSDYNLAVFSRDEGVLAQIGPIFECCRAFFSIPLCGDRCLISYEESALAAITDGKPGIFRCHAGVLNFTIPFQTSDLRSYCLMGGGLREESLDLPVIERMAEENGMDPFLLMDCLEKLPTSTVQKAAEVAEKVQKLISTLCTETLHSILLEKTMNRLNSIIGVSSQIERADTAEEALSLFSEAAGVIFDLPRIAVAMPTGEGSGFALRGTWGLPHDLGRLSEQKLLAHMPRSARPKGLPLDGELREIFKGVDGDRVTCLPLTTAEKTIGMVSLFDTELNARDASLLELLTGKMAARLGQIERENAQRTECLLAEKLMGVISSLALTENREDLYANILAMAADLLGATSGSIMLADESGEHVQIKTALGMNQQLAQTMKVKLGTGIAGRVAQSGNPLLVNDIERDNRVGVPNRPRFKTKSFISIPMKIKGRAIGVLNLSDKVNQGIFTEADLRILTPFAEHACIMIERTDSLERADMLERLSITDPLTGLYNRRFLEKRMDEELNRSVRYGLNLTVMMLDLDNFKIYNDLCGHIAGDAALRKVGRILHASARQMDIVTRYGGEEFCAILPNTSKKESLMVAERLRRNIENEIFAGEERLPLGRLTTSIGISSFPEDGKTCKSLLNAADLALYQAKAQGRNRVVLFDESTPPCNESHQGIAHKAN